jgi:hypothetical protein
MPVSEKARLEELEKSHSKLMTLKDELRLISMEYADIRSRIEASDVLMDRMVHQMDAEAKMRRLTLWLTLITILLAAIILVRV